MLSLSLPWYRLFSGGEQISAIESKLFYWQGPMETDQHNDTFAAIYREVH
jgi:hypothetical protein